jgi:hypothetical protein
VATTVLNVGSDGVIAAASEVQAGAASAVSAGYVTESASVVSVRTPVLRWRDVDFVGGLLHVRANYTDRRKKVPKGKKVRSVPMTPHVVDELGRLKEREHFTGEDDLVFCNTVGDHLNGHFVLRRFYKALDRAGLRRIRFHDLRHHFGTHAITALDAYTVQSYMGHGHYSTTQRYLHHKPRPEHAQALHEAFGGTPSDGGSTVASGPLRLGSFEGPQGERERPAEASLSRYRGHQALSGQVLMDPACAASVSFRLGILADRHCLVIASGARLWPTRPCVDREHVDVRDADVGRNLDGHHDLIIRDVDVDEAVLLDLRRSGRSQDPHRHGRGRQDGADTRLLAANEVAHSPPCVVGTYTTYDGEREGRLEGPPEKARPSGVGMLPGRQNVSPTVSRTGTFRG